jgi:hypothetical protein
MGGVFGDGLLCCGIQVDVVGVVVLQCWLGTLDARAHLGQARPTIAGAAAPLSKSHASLFLSIDIYYTHSIEMLIELDQNAATLSFQYIKSIGLSDHV